MRAKQRKGVSKGFAIFGMVSCLALAASQLWVAFLSGGDGFDVVFFVCWLALAGGWLWRYRQATDATRTNEPEGGA